MNQNTILTIAVLAGIGAIGYLVYKNTQAKAAAPVVQVTTPGNQPQSETAQIINAGSAALDRVTSLLGA